MSILRTVFARSPTSISIPKHHHIFSNLRTCPLRTQLVRKSLPPPQTLSRPFASAPAPAPGSGGRQKTTSKSAAGPGASVHQLLPERLLVYHAGTGKIGFVAGLKITTIFVAAVFALVMEPAMLRSDASMAKISMASICALIPFTYVAYVSAPFVTHVFLRLPPYARQSRALLERYVRSLPPTAQVEVGTLGLAGRPRATLVAAGDLHPVYKDAGFRQSRGNLVTHTRDVSDLMARKKWYHYRPVSQFGLPQKESGKGGSTSGFKNSAKDAWVYDIVRPLFGQRK